MVWSTTRIIDAGILRGTLKWQRNTGKRFFRTSCTSWHVLLVLSQGSFSFVFRTKYRGRWAGNRKLKVRPSAPQAAKFSNSDYFYGTALRQELCWEIKVDLVNTIVSFLWERKRCVKIWPNVELSFLERTCFVPGFCAACNTFSPVDKEIVHSFAYGRYLYRI